MFANIVRRRACDKVTVQNERLKYSNESKEGIKMSRIGIEVWTVQLVKKIVIEAGEKQL